MAAGADPAAAVHLEGHLRRRRHQLHHYAVVFVGDVEAPAVPGPAAPAAVADRPRAHRVLSSPSSSAGACSNGSRRRLEKATSRKSVAWLGRAAQPRAARGPGRRCRPLLRGLRSFRAARPAGRGALLRLAALRADPDRRELARRQPADAGPPRARSHPARARRGLAGRRGWSSGSAIAVSLSFVFSALAAALEPVDDDAGHAPGHPGPARVAGALADRRALPSAPGYARSPTRCSGRRSDSDLVTDRLPLPLSRVCASSAGSRSPAPVLALLGYLPAASFLVIPHGADARHSSARCT